MGVKMHHQNLLGVRMQHLLLLVLHLLHVLHLLIVQLLVRHLLLFVHYHLLLFVHYHLLLVQVLHLLLVQVHLLKTTIPTPGATSSQVAKLIIGVYKLQPPNLPYIVSGAACFQF